MPRRTSGELPPELVERLSQRDVRERLGVVLPFVTVDGDGFPHPMLLSYLEVRAYNAGTITDHIGRFRDLAEAGVREVMVRLPDLTDAAPLERAAQVIAAFR